MKSKSKQSNVSTFKYVLYSLLLAIILTTITLSFIYNRLYNKYKLDYMPPTITYIINPSISTPKDMNYDKLNEQINTLFDNPTYSLTITDKLDSELLGKCYIFRKKIIIRKGLTYEYYALTLAHELSHLTYKTANERFCEFEAYKRFYNSGDKYLKQIALANANTYLFKGNYNKEYNFTGYLINEYGEF